MGYIDMCSPKGYGFQAAWSGIGYRNQRVWVDLGITFQETDQVVEDFYCTTLGKTRIDSQRNKIPGFLKTGCAKKSSHSTTWQFKAINHHSKAD